MTKIRTTHDDTGLDGVQISSHPARDAATFRRMVAARSTLDAAEGELLAAVLSAREAGDSWTVIGAALNTSRQAAQQRFGH